MGLFSVREDMSMMLVKSCGSFRRRDRFINEFLKKADMLVSSGTCTIDACISKEALLSLAIPRLQTPCAEKSDFDYLPILAYLPPWRTLMHSAQTAPELSMTLRIDFN